MTEVLNGIEQNQGELMVEKTKLWKISYNLDSMQRKEREREKT